MPWMMIIVLIIGGSKGAPGMRPQGSIFFHFHEVSGKKTLTHPLGVAPPLFPPPPNENPESATADVPHVTVE